MRLAARARRRRLRGGGTTGNERLTAATGAVLIGLLAVIGVTILQLRPLLSVHLFVGMLLIPPVLLKLASTGYRFTRYYTARPRLPPQGTARRRCCARSRRWSCSPRVVVFASGVALLFVGPSSRDTLLPIHKVSFIVWLRVHRPARARPPAEAAGALRADYGRPAQLGERRARALRTHARARGRAGRRASCSRSS